MMAGRELNTIADARLAAVTTSGSAVCHTRSPLLSDRRPHRTIITDASANGRELSSPVCIFVSPYDLMICGCQICRPLLTAVLPASVMLRTKTYLLQSTLHRLICPTRLRCPASDSSLESSHDFSSPWSQRACDGLSLNTNKQKIPSSTAGAPSSRNIHCQP